MKERKCLECGESFTGRVDKKFCTDQCRNTFNNRLNSEENKLIRNTNRILKRNRRILLTLEMESSAHAPVQYLSEKGFDFQYHTSSFRDENGRDCRYCYDVGYVLKKDGSIQIVSHGNYPE